MPDFNATEFDAEMQRLLDLRDGLLAIDTLVHRDPLRRFAEWFNECMTGVGGDDIVRAYLDPQTALARKVTAGSITSVSELFDTTSAVLLMTALKYRVRAYHKANPRLRPGPGDATRPSGPGTTLPLFVRTNVADTAAAHSVDPAAFADRHAHRRVVFAEARSLGLLRFRVFRAVRVFELERGTHYGAFRAAARRALLDGEGRVKGFRPSRTPAGDGTAPATAVVRQVRRLYEEADDWIRLRAAQLGYVRGATR